MRQDTKTISKDEVVRVDALNAVDQYVKSTPDPKFRKNPLTWLNGKCWEDEIIQPKIKPLPEGQIDYSKIKKSVNPFLELMKSNNK